MLLTTLTRLATPKRNTSRMTTTNPQPTSSACVRLSMARSIFNRIEKIPMADVLSTGNDGTNYLIVGTDSRDGIVEGDPNAAAFSADSVRNRLFRAKPSLMRVSGACHRNSPRGAAPGCGAESAGAMVGRMVTVFGSMLSRWPG